MSTINPRVWIVTIQMKATEQYFLVVLFILLYKVVLNFESVDEILKCDHSNESYWAILSCDAVYFAVQGGSNFSDGPTFEFDKVWLLQIIILKMLSSVLQ